MDAGVGAAGGKTADRSSRIEFTDSLLQGLLDGGEPPRLALPAVKGSPVVLQAQGNAPQARGNGRGRGSVQTNSMMAISALSPRRRTVRTMRV